MERFKVEYLRLHTIDSEIHSKKYPNVKSLSKMLEVHERTILRDIAFLRESLQAPIAYDKDKGGYFYTRPEFTISDISLDNDEAFALFFNGKLALQFLQGTNLFDRVRFGLESLERRAAFYNEKTSKELAVRIQLAIDTPPISIKREFEEILFESMAKDRLVKILMENGDEHICLPILTTLYKNDGKPRGQYFARGREGGIDNRALPSPIKSQPF